MIEVIMIGGCVALLLIMLAVVAMLAYAAGRRDGWGEAQRDALAIVRAERFLNNRDRVRDSIARRGCGVVDDPKSGTIE